jgi:hypothetical protein
VAVRAGPAVSRLPLSPVPMDGFCELNKVKRISAHQLSNSRLAGWMTCLIRSRTDRFLNLGNAQTGPSVQDGYELRHH